MALAIVQSKAAQATATTNHTVTLDSAPTEGNLVVFAYNIGIADVSITKPSGYTQHDFADRSIVHSASICSKVAGAGESATIAATTAVNDTSSVFAVEVSGNHASPFDVSNSFDNGTGNVTSLDSCATGTLSQADEIIFSIVGLSGGNGGSEAIDSGFTLIQEAVTTFATLGYKIVSATTSENPTHSWATGRTAVAVIASFKAAAAADFVRPTIIVAPSAALHRASDW